MCNADVQDLVSRMLHVDPQQRLKAQHVLNHQWLAQRHQLPRAPKQPTQPQQQPPPQQPPQQPPVVIRTGATDAAQLKATMRATYNAMQHSPVPVLEPVHASDLAKRRSLRAGRPRLAVDTGAGEASSSVSGGSACSAGVSSLTEAMNETSFASNSHAPR